MRRDFILFLAFCAGGMVLAAVALRDTVTVTLAYLWSAPFRYAVIGMLMLAGVLVIARLTVRRPVLSRYFLRSLYAAVFLPVLLLPVFRCSFRVPFVFCRACPTRCPWGFLRPFLLPAMLFLNLFARSWCAGFCPLGSLQECASAFTKRKAVLPAWFAAFPYGILAVIAVLFALSIARPGELFPFMTGYYVWGTAAFIVAIGFFAASFFIPRCWCRYACPVGTIASITSSLTRKSSAP